MMPRLFTWLRPVYGTRRLYLVATVVAEDHEQSERMVRAAGVDLTGAVVVEKDMPISLTWLNIEGALPTLEDRQRTDPDYFARRSQLVSATVMDRPIKYVHFSRSRIVVVMIDGSLLEFTSPFDLECRYIPNPQQGTTDETQTTTTMDPDPTR